MGSERLLGWRARWARAVRRCCRATAGSGKQKTPIPGREAKRIARSAPPPGGFLLGGARPRRLTRNKYKALKLGEEHAVLVKHTLVHLDGAEVGLGLRLLLLKHLGLAVQSVAVEHRRRMLELFGCEVGDRLATDVAHRHAQRERVHERAHDDVAALLSFGRVDVVEVQWVVVHRDQ